MPTTSNQNIEMLYRSMVTAYFLAVLAFAASNADDADGFTPLFNGQDLTGWAITLRQPKEGKPFDPKDVFSVANGAIICTGKPNGYIATTAEYENYTLKLKWRYPADIPAGNSGVLLHVQAEDKVWPQCIEAQLRSGRAGDFWLNTPPEVKLEVDAARFDTADKTARHYFREPKEGDIEKPFGEWNEYVIDCNAGAITLTINGRKVNEGKNSTLKKGRIAFQSEGTIVHFKDVAIRVRKGG